MKNLSKVLSVLLVFFIASGFGSKTITGIINTEKEQIVVSFNRHLKFNDLVKIKLDLAEKGISIDYKLLEFDENGGLKSLEFKVDCNDGFSGNAKNTKIYNNTNFGFFRDYSDTAKVPFGTGGLDF